MKCSLCSEQTLFFYSNQHREYYFCNECSSISLNKNCRLNAEDEKNHYEKHNNDVEDVRYQKFVSPIVNQIILDFGNSNKGLDFGSGTGPVITKMLRDQNFDIETYDFYFDPNLEALQKKYDYIACCEVVEHFYDPHKEFQLLFDLLNKGGKLYCMTELYQVESNFDTWYYKTDPTHVFFYTQKTFEWIRKEFGFEQVSFHGRMIVLEK